MNFEAIYIYIFKMLEYSSHRFTFLTCMENIENF